MDATFIQEFAKNLSETTVFGERAKLTVEILAFVISVLAYWFSRRAEREVFNLTIRNQFADAVNKIFNAKLEQSLADAQVDRFQAEIDAQPELSRSKDIREQEKRARISDSGC